MHFDLIDLRLFLHIVEAGSITGGAARAGLALASASARVRGMEGQAGVPLLERARRGVEPTQAGLALLRHARLITGQMERMRGEIGDYACGLKGQVRLVANTAAAAEFVPEILAGFLQANPNVDVELQECASPEVARAIVEEEADVGILADYVDLAGLEVRPFRDDRLVLIVPAHHPLAGRGQIAFAEALGFEFVGLAGDSALGSHLASHAVRAGRRMRTRVRVGGLDTICRMVTLGAGIAIVPEATARRWPSLALVGLDDPWAKRRLVVIVRQLDALSSHARRLVETLVKN